MNEAMNLVGKTDDELKYRKIIKSQLKITKIPKLVLGTKDDG